MVQNAYIELLMQTKSSHNYRLVHLETEWNFPGEVRAREPCASQQKSVQRLWEVKRIIAKEEVRCLFLTSLKLRRLALLSVKREVKQWEPVVSDP